MTQAPVFGTYRPSTKTSWLLAATRHTLLGRGYGRKKASAWLRASGEEPLDVQLFGGNARLHVMDNHPERKALLTPKYFAPSEFAFCRQHMPRDGGVFLDVGANAGIFSLYLASIMNTGTIISVEPIPELFRRLSTNLKVINPQYTDRLEFNLFNCALGGTEGEMMLHIPQELGQSSLRFLGDAEKVVVPIRPMLDVLIESDIQRVDVMKIDVEGFEDSILSPFYETAPPELFPRAIVMEHCHSARWSIDCEALLKAKGYKIAKKDRTNLLLLLSDH